MIACSECPKSYFNKESNEVDCSLPAIKALTCPNLEELGTNEQEYDPSNGYN